MTKKRSGQKHNTANLLTEQEIVLLEGRHPMQEGGNRDEDIPEVEEAEAVQCPYLSPIVHVYVGVARQMYSVHQAVISELNIPPSNDYFHDGLRLSEIEPELFEQLLSYVYRGNYVDYAVKKKSAITRVDVSISKLRSHILLYWYGTKYNVPNLKTSAKMNIEISNPVSYRNLLEIAKEAYLTFQLDDPWFGTYIREHTRTAWVENQNLPGEDYVVDIIRSQTTALVDHLFASFTTEMGPHHHAYTLEDASIDICSTSNVSPEISTPCKLRNKHLKNLQDSKAPWSKCPKCHHERDQLMTTGRALISVAFSDLLPGLLHHLSVSESPAGKTKKEKKQIRRELKMVLQSLPIAGIMSKVLEDPAYEPCPDQIQHLKQKGGSWLWEGCTMCLRDRGLMMEKVRQLSADPNLSIIENTATPEPAHTPPDSPFTPGSSLAETEPNQDPSTVNVCESVPIVDSRHGKETSQEVIGDLGVRSQPPVESSGVDLCAETASAVEEFPPNCEIAELCNLPEIALTYEEEFSGRVSKKPEEDKQKLKAKKTVSVRWKDGPIQSDVPIGSLGDSSKCDERSGEFVAKSLRPPGDTSEPVDDLTSVRTLSVNKRTDDQKENPEILEAIWTRSLGTLFHADETAAVKRTSEEKDGSVDATVDSDDSWAPLYKTTKNKKKGEMRDMADETVIRVPPEEKPSQFRQGDRKVCPDRTYHLEDWSRWAYCEICKSELDAFAGWLAWKARHGLDGLSFEQRLFLCGSDEGDRQGKRV